jgi:hypothetical protein
MCAHLGGGSYSLRRLIYNLDQVFKDNRAQRDRNNYRFVFYVINSRTQHTARRALSRNILGTQRGNKFELLVAGAPRGRNRRREENILVCAGHLFIIYKCTLCVGAKGTRES